MEVKCSNSIFFKGVQHVYCPKFMLTVSHNGNPIIYNTEIKYTKTRIIFSNQNAWTSEKGATFAAFTVSIVMEHNQNTTDAINHQRAILINCHDHS